MNFADGRDPATLTTADRALPIYETLVPLAGCNGSAFDIFPPGTPITADPTKTANLSPNLRRLGWRIGLTESGHEVFHLPEQVTTIGGQQ